MPAQFMSMERNKMKITETIVNVKTQQTKMIEKDLSPVEIAEREEAQVKAQLMQAEEETKIMIRKNILHKLGLTEEEAAFLLG